MLKALCVAGTLALVGAPAMAEAEPEAPPTESPAAGTIVATVNGMVCDFCAQAVKKVFGREDAVEDVSINLDDGTIVIVLKPGAALGDEAVTELVRKSGYALVSIARGAA